MGEVRTRVWTAVRDRRGVASRGVRAKARRPFSGRATIMARGPGACNAARGGRPVASGLRGGTLNPLRCDEPSVMGDRPMMRLLIAAASLAGQTRDLDELAHRIVTTSLVVKPGEVVVINGGKHTIPLMEALAIEADKAGGMVTILLDSDRVIRSLNVDVPEQYLKHEPR